MRIAIKHHKVALIIVFLMLIGAFLRFYNLNWGAPFYFHPDERNIASSVSQLIFPTHMNPKFFAYGSFPIYVIYFTGLYSAALLAKHTMIVSFANAIVLSRFYTAFFSMLLIPLMYITGKRIGDTRAGIIAAFLTTFCVGFIQFAHFGTFEIWLTLGSMLLFLLCLFYGEKPSVKNAFFLGLVFGLLCAMKVSTATLILAVFFVFLRKLPKDRAAFQTLLTNVVIFGITALVVYFATNPYVIKDTVSFTNSMHYESGVALGSIPVFYTQEFVHMIPILYPFIHIYPFLLNPLLTIFFVIAVFFAVFAAVKTKAMPLRLLVLFFFIIFLSQAFLYVQWTRYYVPTLPFMLLSIAWFLSKSIGTKHSQKLLTGIGIVTALISIIFAVSYFITAYVEPDTRLQALSFAQNHIPHDATILSEVYDLGVVPFNGSYHNIFLYDFYSLDGTGGGKQTPKELVKDVSYVLLPSQRIIKSRLLYPYVYPNGNAFYKKLDTGKLGFKKMYETPCSIFCKIAYLGDPVYSYEGTASVFDRPTVWIFQKQ